MKNIFSKIFFPMFSAGKPKGEFWLEEDFSPVVTEFPLMVMVDTTTRCNLSCAHCPSSRLAEEPGYIGDIDVALYEKIINEIAAENKKTIVRPFDGGEPFMRKDIEDLIRFAKQSGIEYVSINSNGLLITKERCEKLLESGLDHIEVSIDAATPETYAVIRRSKHYCKLIENINYLLARRDATNNKMKVTVSFIKQRGNLHELELFHSRWQGKADGVCIREYHQHNRLIDGSGAYKVEQKTERYPCPYLWGRIIINHDGRVRFCESDWRSTESVVGDVNVQTIKEIWHGKAYGEVRRTHLERKFEHSFCYECSDWREISW